MSPQRDVEVFNLLVDVVAERVIERIRPTAQPPASPALMTLAEAREVLRISDPTIRRWCRNGKLPTQRPGHLVLVREEDVRALLVGSRSEGKPVKLIGVESPVEPEVERAWARLTREAS